MKRMMFVKRILMILGVSALVFSNILIGSCGGGSSRRSCENKCTMLFGKDSDSQSYRNCMAACLDEENDTDDSQSDNSDDEEFPINLSVEALENTNTVALSWEGPADTTNAGGFQIIRNDQKTENVALDETYFEDTPIISDNYCYEICAHASGMASGVCLKTSNRVCIDVETPIVWAYDSEDEIEIISGNASNSVAVVTDQGDIIQIGSNGNVNWRYASDEQIISIRIDNSGNVYALYRGTDADALIAISKEGAFQWQTDASGARAPLLIGNDDKFYYLSTDSLNVYLNIVGPGGSAEEKVLVADTGLTMTLRKFNADFLFGSTNYVYSLDSSGNLNWKYAASTSLSAPAIGQSDVVYVGANQTLVALNGSNGSFLWSQDFDTSLSNSKISASDDDTVYVSLDGVLHAIDAEGQSLWKYEANTSIGAPLAIDSEEVFLPCYGGCMILFDHLGNIVWEQCHNSFLAIDSTSVNHSGYSFYTEFPSTVYAIDSDQL